MACFFHSIHRTTSLFESAAVHVTLYTFHGLYKRSTATSHGMHGSEPKVYEFQRFVLLYCLQTQSKLPASFGSPPMNTKLSGNCQHPTSDANAKYLVNQPSTTLFGIKETTYLTQRPGKRHSRRDVVVYPMGGRDRFRLGRNTFFDPLHHGGEDVV